MGNVIIQTPPNILFRSMTTLFPLSSTTTAAKPAQCYNYTTRLATANATDDCDSTVSSSVSTNVPTFVRFVSPGGCAFRYCAQ
ncbi:unnamed protein product [Adineta ricciae]|uniref:Uncharacterized protein n=1 Tax=Adineta ricciae TaxID=249248 RepID=A0A815SWP7_ADIRI|nr:unnamed protein product [Adineta ricciae]CAF1493471.1 unnamed protein product [Adineta ricciae]